TLSFLDGKSLEPHTAASALEAVKNADTSGCDPVPEMIARFKKAH
ncbi:TPA: hypothetical protein MAJ50_005430, partial [Klebsiella pneumoniae]|nr:hypothetical protein [Klebsiella pneumoniae]